MRFEIIKTTLISSLVTMTIIIWYDTLGSAFLYVVAFIIALITIVMLFK